MFTFNITFNDYCAILLIETKEQLVDLTNKLDFKHHCNKLLLDLVHKTVGIKLV